MGEQDGQADRPLVHPDGEAGGKMAAGEDQAAVYRGDEALPRADQAAHSVVGVAKTRKGAQIACVLAIIGL